MNICKEIRCPFDGKHGCQRYTVSGHCHLLAGKEQLKGEPFYQRSGISNNQYWLFANDAEPLVDINELREQNRQFIEGDPISQKRLKWMR